MKTPNQIGQAIRDKGGKVGYAPLVAFVSKYEPVFIYKQTKFYSEETEQAAIDHFVGNTAVKQDVINNFEKRLDHIEQMLANVLNELGVKNDCVCKAE